MVSEHCISKFCLFHAVIAMLKVLVIFLELFLAGCTAGANPRPSTAQPEAPARKVEPAADPALAAERQRLSARAAELEKELNASPPLDVKSLLEMVGRGEAAALSREIEKHLLAGEPGHAVLHDFFHQADIQHEKIDALTHHPQLIFALLRLVGLYPNETAALSRHLIKATKERPESWIRRELFNFLPVFILHHQGKYPELRRDLEEDIIYQIQMGGIFLYKVDLAMKDLNFRPPVEIFLPLLVDASKHELHGMVLEHLVSRKDEGLKVLLRYLEESKNFKTPTVGAVLGAIQKLDQEQKSGKIEQLLEHPDEDLRRAAHFTYFSQPREATELPRALDMLNSTSYTAVQKRALVSILAQRSPELFELLFDQEERLTDSTVQSQVRRTAESIARRKAKKRGEGAAPAPESKPTEKASP